MCHLTTGIHRHMVDDLKYLFIEKVSLRQVERNSQNRKHVGETLKSEASQAMTHVDHSALASM